MSPPSEPIAPEALLRHAGLLRRLTRALLADEASVDDVTQNTWVAALEHPPRKPEGLSSWLGSVARRFALRQLRGDARRGRREQAVARPEAVDEGDEDLRTELLLERVTQAVLELDEPYRSTVILRFYRCLGPVQIAKRTGVPVATVASRLQRALARIRASLDRRTSGGRAAWSASASSMALAKGALIMSSKLKLTAGALALVVGGLALWRVLPSGDPARPGERANVVIARGELDLARSPAEHSPLRDETPSRELVPAVLELAESSPVPTTGSLLLHVTWADTGDPAVDRGFRFFPWDSREPFRESIVRVTGERGEIYIDALAAGSVMFYGELSGGGRVEIVSGETTEGEMSLPAGMLVTGRVVAPDGSGVVGARIWISDEMNGDKGHVITESGVGGRFSIAGVGSSRSLAAFADGYSPALPQDIEGHSGETVELLFELGATGCAVHGIVVDANGRPIPGSKGARVRVESLMRSTYQRPDGSWVRAFAPLEQRCDETGGFEFVGIPLERVRLSVRAPDFASDARELDPELESHHHRVVLTAAGVVFGVLRDAQGKPLAGVRVSEGPYGEFTSSFGRTRADGSYRLANLPLGSVELFAEHKEHGRASLVLALAAGEPLEWSPRLASQQVLVGKIVDEEGAPRAGFTIDAGGSRSKPGSLRLWSAQVTTAENGEFRFANCPDEELSIEVHDTGYIKVKEMRRVRPGGEPLFIVIGDDELPSAGVRGTVVDASGAPVAANVVLVGPKGAGGYHETRCEADTGEFELAPLPPGDYSIRLLPDELPEVPRARIELEGDDILDLGEWRLGVPSRIELEVEGYDDVGPFEVVTLSRKGGDGVWFAARRYVGEESNEIHAWPGTYILQARSPDLCAVTQEIEVVEGASTRVRLVPYVGAECVIELDAGSQPLPAMLSFSVVDDQRQNAASWTELNPATSELTFTRRLRAGNYTLVVRSRTSERCQLSFTVPENEERVRVHAMLE